MTSEVQEEGAAPHTRGQEIFNAVRMELCEARAVAQSGTRVAVAVRRSLGAWCVRVREASPD